jgi:hypothetical protein
MVYKASTTFFGKQDRWVYHAIFDDRIDDECLQWTRAPVYQGNQIRRLWPYLTIHSHDKIGGPDPNGKGMVHPNCRCWLERLESHADEEPITYVMNR